MKRTSSLSIAVVVLGFLVSSSAVGQQLATLKVTISDPSGAVIPGAVITLTNTETGAKRTDITESHGLSVIPGVPAGSYEMTAEAKGFSPLKMPVTLSVGQISSFPVTLGISVKEEVKVEETIQGIDTEQSEVSQVIDTPKIADLPISGRDFIDFVLLTPSVNVEALAAAPDDALEQVTGREGTGQSLRRLGVLGTVMDHRFRGGVGISLGSMVGQHPQETPGHAPHAPARPAWIRPAPAVRRRPRRESSPPFPIG